MARFIALPLYDHTSAEEIAECLDALRSIGLDDAIAIDTARDWTELDAEIRAVAPELRPHERRSIELAAELDAHRAVTRPCVLPLAPVGEDGYRIDRPESILGPCPLCISLGCSLAEARECGDPAHRERIVVGDPAPGTREWDRRDELRERAGMPPAQVGAVVYSIEQAEELRRIREGHGVSVGLDRYEVKQPSRFRDHGEEIAYHRSLDLLRIASAPIDGRPGWRRTPDGREWYSAAWLDQGAVS